MLLQGRSPYQVNVLLQQEEEEAELLSIEISQGFGFVVGLVIGQDWVFLLVWSFLILPSCILSKDDLGFGIKEPNP